MKFIHHRLSVGKVQFTLKHTYPYYHQPQTNETSNDHFLLSDKQKNKKTKIEKIRLILSKLYTPLNIKKIISKNVSSYYNNIIQKRSNVKNVK